MHTFIFLVLIKILTVAEAGILHPCQIRTYACRFFGQSKHMAAGGFGNTGECIEVKTNEPLNSVMETLNGGGQ
ncbi:hypothetical protein K8Q81_23485 [Escherichia coli]